MIGWFARYDPDDHLAEPARDCAAWLTGQSSFEHSSLSPGQMALLDDVAGLGYNPVRSGFPYNSALLAVPYRKEPVIGASVRNAAQFAAARTSRRFAEDLARHLQPLLDHTSRRLLLLCGSCGAELFTAALPHLRVPAGLRVLVVALGPVGRLPDEDARVKVRVVRGTRDWLSRAVSRVPEQHLVPGGHLDYVKLPQVRAVVLSVGREFLR